MRPRRRRSLCRPARLVARQNVLLLPVWSDVVPYLHPNNLVFMLRFDAWPIYYPATSAVMGAPASVISALALWVSALSACALSFKCNSRTSHTDVSFGSRPTLGFLPLG